MLSNGELYQYDACPVFTEVHTQANAGPYIDGHEDTESHETNYNMAKRHICRWTDDGVCEQREYPSEDFNVWWRETGYGGLRQYGSPYPHCSFFPVDWCPVDWLRALPQQALRPRRVLPSA